MGGIHSYTVCGFEGRGCTHKRKELILAKEYLIHGTQGVSTQASKATSLSGRPRSSFLSFAHRVADPQAYGIRKIYYGPWKVPTTRRALHHTDVCSCVNDLHGLPHIFASTRS